MHVKRVTEDEARAIANKYDLDISIMLVVKKSGSMHNGRYEFVMCGSLAHLGYDDVLACSINDLSAGQVERFNII